MTGAELRTIRTSLGLTTGAFARAVGLCGADGDRTVRRWEAGDSAVPGPVVRLLTAADHFPAVRDWLKKNRLTRCGPQA